eukprot:8809636-Lingulodinium_polyedra.AAC.1
MASADAPPRPRETFASTRTHAPAAPNPHPGRGWKQNGLRASLRPVPAPGRAGLTAAAPAERQRTSS